MKIIKKIYNWIMPPVTPPVKTVSQILTDLNKDTSANWVQVPGLFSIITPSIQDKIINYLDGKNGIVLAVFLNLNNAEIKTFVAKYLDVPERDKLL